MSRVVVGDQVYFQGVGRDVSIEMFQLLKSSGGDVGSALAYSAVDDVQCWKKPSSAVARGIGTTPLHNRAPSAAPAACAPGWT